MNSKSTRRTTAAEWEVERAQQHIASAMAAITRGGGLLAADPHLVKARACFLRAFAGNEGQPHVVELLGRLEAMRATCAAQGAGEVRA